nr:MAG TPA: hypothetical protein [Caudoviricetes sp.]DAZ18911.1 MAG TPA: hypothetical protein [Caudoviricetes sp.]
MVLLTSFLANRDSYYNLKVMDDLIRRNIYVTNWKLRKIRSFSGSCHFTCNW